MITTRTTLDRPRRGVRPVVLAALLCAAPAWAHHSFAMFDMNRHLSVTGTVRALEWSNPHVWLWVDVTDDKGNVVAYGFEGASPAELSRNAHWTKHSVAPGERVTVQYSPLKDGRPGGSLGVVTKADGTMIRAGAPPPGGPGAPPAPGPARPSPR